MLYTELYTHTHHIHTHTSHTHNVHTHTPHHTHTHAYTHTHTHIHVHTQRSSALHPRDALQVTSQSVEREMVRTLTLAFQFTGQ